MSNLLSENGLKHGMLVLTLMGSSQEVSQHYSALSVTEPITFEHGSNNFSTLASSELFELHECVEINDASNFDQGEVIQRFVDKMIISATDIEDEFQKIVNENFWDMI